MNATSTPRVHRESGANRWSDSGRVARDESEEGGGASRGWAGVVVVMLLLPEWLIWGPKAYLRVLLHATNQPAVVATAPRMLVNRTLTAQADPAPPVAHPAPRWPKLALGLYLLGLGILLVRLTIGTARAYTLARRAVNRAGRLTSAACAAPVTVGWLHPVVILPEQWFQWPAAQMDAVWTHELEHAADTIHWCNGSPFSTVQCSGSIPSPGGLSANCRPWPRKLVTRRCWNPGTTHASIPNACSTWPVP